jgi:hypothetical protein
VTAGRRIAGQIDNVVAALDSGAKRLGSAVSSLLMAVDDAAGESFAVDDATWAVTDPHGSDREEQRLTHEAIIHSRLATLVSEDEAVGFAIDAAIDETTATADDVAAGRDYCPAVVGAPAGRPSRRGAAGSAVSGMGTPPSRRG